MKKPKPVHLRMNDHNSLTACRKYTDEERLTYDISKTTCEGCWERIKLIWTIDGRYSEMKKLLIRLMKELEEFNFEEKK